MENTTKRTMKVKVGKQRLPIGKHSMKIGDWSEIQESVSKYGNECQTIEVLLKGKVHGRVMEVWQKLWIHNNPSSLFQQLVFATGIEVDEEGNIDLQDTIGKTVLVEVEQQGNFVNIVRFTSTFRATGNIFGDI